MSANPYDTVPYQSFAYAASHPGRLASIAALFNVATTAPAASRVLEIGCAAGGNLLPMAAAFPEARFVGIDYSAVQIEVAEKSRAALGLTNIEFRCEDIRAVSASQLGRFDYVIAHGIYSWLPPDAQAAMLALYRDCLAPQGVGYISYNTLPGWRMRGIVRDMMLFHAELFGDPLTQVTQAKALLDFMARHVPAENNPYGQYLRSELALVSGVNDSYLKHDHLEDHNEPLYFRDFMNRARAVGLDYLGESEFSTMLGAGISSEAMAQLNAEIKDIVRLEQYLDFLRNRSFRMTLLVRQGAAIDRNVSGARLASLQVAAQLRPVDQAPDLGNTSPVSFQGKNGTGIRTSNPVTKAALTLLAEIFPAALPFDELLARARATLPAGHCAAVAIENDRTSLGNDLLTVYTLPGLLRLDACATPVTRQPGERPQASAYARWQANTSAVVTNLLHETVSLDAPSQLLLTLLDGTRDRAALAEAMCAYFDSGRLQMQNDGQPVKPAVGDPALKALVDRCLELLAMNALLTAG